MCLCMLYLHLYMYATYIPTYVCYLYTYVCCIYTYICMLPIYPCMLPIYLCMLPIYPCMLPIYLRMYATYIPMYATYIPMYATYILMYAVHHFKLLLLHSNNIYTLCFHRPLSINVFKVLTYESMERKYLHSGSTLPSTPFVSLFCIICCTHISGRSLYSECIVSIVLWYSGSSGKRTNACPLCPSPALAPPPRRNPATCDRVPPLNIEVKLPIVIFILRFSCMAFISFQTQIT